MSVSIVIAGLIVGVLVGMTGAGGGALMTPILILVFGVTPSAAVSSDLVASAIMRPFGGGIHFKRGTVHMGLVGWLSLGSVPAAFAGVFIDRALGSGRTMQQNIDYAMGAAVFLAAAAMIVKLLLDSATQRPDDLAEAAPEIVVKRVLTVAIGVFGGLLVGVTSVGAGSLMMILIMMLHPRMPMRHLVGTFIVQSVPPVVSAAVGHAVFGGLELGLTAAITVGSVPGVIVGSWLSSRASNLVLKPTLAFVLMASALKLLGVGPTPLAITMGIVALLGFPLWAFIDGYGRPAAAWTAAGHRRRRTLTLVGAGAPVAVGFVTAAVYFARQRPRIVRATSEIAGTIPEHASIAA